MSSVAPKGNSWRLGLFVHSDVDDSDLSVYEFRVYARLCRRAGEELRVWEGQKKIAEGCKMSRAAVQKALYGLRDRGWVELHEFKRDDGSKGPNNIILCGPPAFQEGDPPPLRKAGVASEKGSISSSNEVDPSEGTTNRGIQKSEHLTLPAWLSEEAWGDFLAHRKTLKAPVTELSGKRLLKTLEELRGQGHDPVKVIDQSIATGKWTGLFPLKANTSGSYQQVGAVRGQEAAFSSKSITLEEPDF